MINMPESADVTKNVSNNTTTNTDKAIAIFGDSKRFMVVNSWAEISELTIVPCAMPLSSKSIAVAPTKVSHVKQIRDGIMMAPKTYSRMVRPRETRARNIPTKGAKAIHHAQ